MLLAKLLELRANVCESLDFFCQSSSDLNIIALKNFVCFEGNKLLRLYKGISLIHSNNYNSIRKSDKIKLYCTAF